MEITVETKELTDEEFLAEFDDECAVILRETNNVVRQSVATIAQSLWDKGQAWKFAKAACPPGRWSAYLKHFGYEIRFVQQCMALHARWKRSEVPNFGQTVLLALSAPSVDDDVTEAFEARVAIGEKPPTVIEAREAISKAQAPAPVNHDIDRTTQEPNVAVSEGSEALDRVIAAMRKQLKKAIAICGQLDRSEWDRLEQSLQQMVDDVKHA